MCSVEILNVSFKAMLHFETLGGMKSLNVSVTEYLPFSTLISETRLQIPKWSYIFLTVPHKT